MKSQRSLPQSSLYREVGEEGGRGRGRDPGEDFFPPYRRRVPTEGSFLLQFWPALCFGLLCEVVLGCDSSGARLAEFRGGGRS